VFMKVLWVCVFHLFMCVYFIYCGYVYSNDTRVCIQSNLDTCIKIMDTCIKIIHVCVFSLTRI